MDEYQKEVDAWFKEKGWEYWEPLSMRKSLDKVMTRDKDRFKD